MDLVVRTSHREEAPVEPEDASLGRTVHIELHRLRPSCWLGGSPSPFSVWPPILHHVLPLFRGSPHRCLGPFVWPPFFGCWKEKKKETTKKRKEKKTWKSDKVKKKHLRKKRKTQNQKINNEKKETRGQKTETKEEEHRKHIMKIRRRRRVVVKGRRFHELMRRNPEGPPDTSDTCSVQVTREPEIGRQPSGMTLNSMRNEIISHVREKTWSLSWCSGDQLWQVDGDVECSVLSTYTGTVIAHCHHE